MAGMGMDCKEAAAHVHSHSDATVVPQTCISCSVIRPPLVIHIMLVYSILAVW